MPLGNARGLSTRYRLPHDDGVGLSASPAGECPRIPETGWRSRVGLPPTAISSLTLYFVALVLLDYPRTVQREAAIRADEDPPN